MDCFDSHHYRLHCKLLSLIGQWPYDKFAVKVTRRILYVSFIVLSVLPQTALIVVGELDFNMRMEITCCHVTIVLVIGRSLLFVFNQDEMMKLLEHMKRDWLSLANKDEHDILIEVAEEARRDMKQYIIIFVTGFTLNTAFTILQPRLRNTDLMNGTSSTKLFYHATYFIDEEKYFYLIMAHMSMVAVVIVVGIFSADGFLVIFMYHLIGMFKITCHQFEHIFDNYHDEISGSSVRRTICQKTASAIEWHKRALRFRDGIVMTTQWLNFVTVILTIIDISLALFWVFMSKGHGIGTILTLELVFHAFFLAIPAQKIVDTSVEITYKAYWISFSYSSLWYVASAKNQKLVLLIMQRGLRPSYILMGKVHPITLEHFAMVIKSAFSYFTAFLSLK